MIDLNKILTPGTSISVAPGTHSPLPVQLSGTLTVTKISIADGIKQTISYTDSSVYYRDIFPARGVVGEWVCDSFGSITDWKDLNLVPTEFSSRWPTFAEVTQKPSTLAGFGITDAFKKSGGEINGLISVIDGQNIELKQSSTGTYNSIKFLGSDLSLKSKIQYVNGSLDLGSSVTVQGAVLVNAAQSTAVNSLTRRDYVDSGLNTKLNLTGGTLTGPVSLKTIQGQGSSIGWASIDVTGTKGGYSGINFPDSGHWFGIRPDGLSGVWDSAGNSKWYFNESGQLTGGAKVPWGIIYDHPSRNNWANQPSLGVVVGELAWKNYGNGHTIFDASAGTSPDGTTVDKNNSQIAWRSNDANYPTLMGWNGVNTYGVRVDSARAADASITADRLTGVVGTNGQDLTIHGKRAMVGSGDSNTLILNYGNDWGSTIINGNVFTGPLQSDRLLAIKNGSTVYSNSQIEARSTDGSDARIGFHRAGYSAGAINHNSWGFQFEREAGGGSRANVAAANFFADAAQDMSGNALTRKDYVDGNFIKRRTRLHPDDGTSLDNVQQEHGFNYSTGGGIFGPYISFGGLYGNYECQINADFISGNDIKFRTHNGDSNRWNSWRTIWNSGNFDPNSYLNATTGGTVSGVVYNSVTGTPNTFVGGKISSEAGTLSLDAYSYAFVTSPHDVHLCHNSYYQPSTGWRKYDNNRPSGKVVISEGSGLQYLRSDAGSSDPNQHAYTVFHTGNLAPLAENGTYGGTLHLGNWFRSYGASGWYNETYGGGIWMDEDTTVKVYAGKKFYVSNSEYNAIGATGGIFSYQRMSVDTRQQIGNGGSFNAYRSIDAPFHAGHGGLDGGTFAPIVGSANYTNGQGYTTRVHLGVRSVGADWTRAVLMVGSAESTSHPCATYEFDAYGNMTGITTVNAVNLVSSRTDGVTGLELRNTGGNPGLSFHRPGQSWAELRHDGSTYFMAGDGKNFTIGNDMICSYAYANGAQPQVSNALTRKDYVDSRDWYTRWENKQVPNHSSGNANSHYESEWDGNGVSNAPNTSWFFFREMYHSGGSNWRHQEAFDFFANEEYFRRGINASDYSAWYRRWHSGNFDPASKSDVTHTHALATNATSGLMSAADKFKLDNIQRSKSTQETTLWSGEAGSSTSTITVSQSLYNFPAVRFMGTNADRSICWSLTMPAHEWAAQCASGKAISVEAGAYYFSFAAPSSRDVTLFTRNTNNCYLTSITGLK